MRGKFLKPNHRTETIHQAIWVDTETEQIQIGPYEQGHVLMQGFSAYSRWHPKSGWSKPEWFKFTSSGDFWDWVESKIRARIKMYVFAHNTGFDLPVLDAFRELPLRGWTSGKIVVEAPPTIMELRKGKSTLCLLDTLNWWRVPLKSLGDSLGLPKLEFPSPSATAEEWDTYNRRDVEIIMVAVQRWCDFLREHDLGGFAPTLAGQSMRSFRHRFMHHKILIDDNDKALECSRECYHGGRTEAWFIGKNKGNFHLVDVNSMYPYVMHEYSYPTILRWYTRVTNAKDLKQSLKRYAICARVRVKVDRPALPVVHDGKLIYPIGEFDACLSTPQLQWVLKHGEVIKVYDMSLYDHKPIFKEYVSEIYNHRLEYKRKGDEVNTFLFKILLNSLYGKFGQRGLVFTEIDTTDDLNPAAWKEVNVDTGEVESYRQIMGIIMKLEKSPESGGSHPAIAAHVTAYASMYLFRLAEIAGTDHVYYMDTDSLLVDDIGLEKLTPLCHDTRLGALKHEGTWHDIDIHGAKDYKFGDKQKIKGIRKGAEWFDDNTAQQDKWCGLRGLIRSGQANMPITSRILKTLSRQYDKGIVGPDGRVQPLVLGED